MTPITTLLLTAQVCSHILHTLPTPAPLNVALIDEHNVLFTCPGDPKLETITVILPDVEALEFWRDNAPERIIDDEEEGED